MRPHNIKCLLILAALVIAVLGMVFWPAPTARVVVPQVYSDSDNDNDGILDAVEFVNGARDEAINRTAYSGAYYAGGYPPEGEGACTDVIWRAFRQAGYDLKTLVDEDIRLHPEAYPRVNGQPDPNIDFRRVSNLVVFLERYATSLTTSLRSGNTENLANWQGGDIVVYAPPLEHIAIVSDRRRNDGVPLLIHNCGPYASEEDRIDSWPTRITHHFRFPAQEDLPNSGNQTRDVR